MQTQKSGAGRMRTDAAPVNSERLSCSISPDGLRDTQFVPFPAATLPKPLGSFTMAAAKALGCDSSYVALPLLATLASLIGNNRRIRLTGDWAAPPILWVALVGESGTSKTPAFELVMKPVNDLQRKALACHAERMREYESALAQYDKELAQWKQKNTPDESPKKPPEPQAARFVVSDTTIEALAPLLLANPRGLLLARDELAGWIGSFDRYAAKGGGDAASWLSMYNAGTIINDRKTGNLKTLFVPAASVCVCGGIQPGILNRALGNEHRESGLLARLLLTWPPQKQKVFTKAVVSPADKDEIAYLIGRLHELQPAVVDGIECPVVVGLTPDALAAYEAFYNAHGEEQVGLTGDLAAAWSKLQEIPARLALIIHCCRVAVDDPKLESADAVDLASMTAGIRLATWFKHETKRVYSLLRESDDDRDVRRLVEWISRNGGEVTSRKVQQGCRWLKEPGTAEAALIALAEAGHGEWRPVPPAAKGGPATRDFGLFEPSAVYATRPAIEGNTSSVDVDGVDVSETSGAERKAAA